MQSFELVELEVLADAEDVSFTLGSRSWYRGCEFGADDGVFGPERRKLPLWLLRILPLDDTLEAFERGCVMRKSPSSISSGTLCSEAARISGNEGIDARRLCRLCIMAGGTGTEPSPSSSFSAAEDA